MVVRGAKARCAFWEGDLERKLKLAYVGIIFVWRLDPEDVGVVYEEGGAKGARAREARLVAANGDGEGLCRDWPAILVESCADDCSVSEVVMEGREGGHTTLDANGGEA